MSHQDKFWNKFGDKARQHKPDLYTPADWQKMELLLDNKPTKRFPPIFLWGGGAVAGVLALALLLWLSAPVVPPVSAFPIPLTEEAAQQPIAALSRTEKNSADPEPRLPEKKPSAVLDEQEKNGGINKDGAIIVAGKNTPVTESTALKQDVPVATGSDIASAGKEEVKNVSELKQQKEAALTARELLQTGQAENLPTLLGPVAYKQEESLAYAQTEKERKWKFNAGMMAGAQLAVPRYWNTAGPAVPFAGLFASASPHPRWAVQLEVQARYVPEMEIKYEFPVGPGTSSNFSDTVLVSGRQRTNFLTLQAPLLVKYRISPRLYVHAGLEGGLIFENPGFASASEDLAAAPVSSDTPQGEENFDLNRSAKVASLELRKYSWGAFAGLEWAFARKWAASLRATHGLTDLSPNSLYLDKGNHRNSGIQLSLYRSF